VTCQGWWVPENESVKIPVAIKVLHGEILPAQNNELLEEARIMASVNHKNCIRILAICMTKRMMIVTQLMTFGCLRDYIRKEHNNIGSQVLLNWCMQIARVGRCYFYNCLHFILSMNVCFYFGVKCVIVPTCLE